MVVLVLIAVLCAGFVAIVLLAKVLSAPKREIADQDSDDAVASDRHRAEAVVRPLPGDRRVT